jgi:hypothetical protein
MIREPIRWLAVIDECGSYGYMLNGYISDKGRYERDLGATIIGNFGSAEDALQCVWDELLNA